MSQPAAEPKPRAARPRRGEELDLRVDALAQGGRGVARTADGFVVFVSGGLPGDRVRARVGKSKRSYAEASVLELVEPAAGRIPDTCLHGGEPCPGAAWQGLRYEDQLAHKAEQVREFYDNLDSMFDRERQRRSHPIELLAHIRALGLPTDATLDDIKKQYKKLAKLYHPDRRNGDSSKMSRINDAYGAIVTFYRAATTG